MASRREVLKLVAAGTAVAAGSAMVGGEVAQAADATEAAALVPKGPAPWWLLRPLALGAPVGKGWSVAGLSEVVAGACVLTLAHDSGRHARVHVCLNSGVPRGPSHSELLDLILMDGGRGEKPTEEGLARVLRDLSDVIRRNELDAGGDLRALAHLMTHGERVTAFGPENLT